MGCDAGAGEFVFRPAAGERAWRALEDARGGDDLTVLELFEGQVEFDSLGRRFHQW